MKQGTVVQVTRWKVNEKYIMSLEVTAEVFATRNSSVGNQVEGKREVMSLEVTAEVFATRNYNIGNQVGGKQEVCIVTGGYSGSVCNKEQ